MRFTFEIDSEDDAFILNPCGEVSRLLRLVSERVNGFADSGRLHDSNGRKCGEWWLELPEPEDEEEENEDE